jgi:hypothetical protein
MSALYSTYSFECLSRSTVQVETIASLVELLNDLKPEDPQRGDDCLMLLDPSCQQALYRLLLQRLEVVVAGRLLPRQDATIRGIVEVGRVCTGTWS